MRKIFIVFFASILLLFFGIVSHLNAQECEVKKVCIDNNHLGMQMEDCEIISALEFLEQISDAFGQGKTEDIYCYVGCANGECIDDGTAVTCEDSDGGADYFTKGRVDIRGAGMQTGASDVCVDSKTVSEAICKATPSDQYEFSASFKNYNCSLGCKDSVCIKPATPAKCEDTDGGKNIFKAGIVKINSQEVIRDRCGFDIQEINEAYCQSDGTYFAETFLCPGVCELTESGALCLEDCSGKEGWHCYNHLDGPAKAFFTKDCEWEKITPCEGACNLDQCESSGDKIDSDGDGILDINETKYGTNPNNADTDGDGYEDGAEVYAGYNPLEAEGLTVSQPEPTKISSKTIFLLIISASALILLVAFCFYIIFRFRR